MRRRICPAFLIVVIIAGGAPNAVAAVSAETSEPPAEAAASQDDSAPRTEPTLVERITVTATRTENEIQDTAGTTSVVTAGEISFFGMKDARDLLRFEPGVYVADDPSRFGLNGFTIRGIGGNRVMTRIDGVQTAEQFDFGPIAAPQYALDLDTVESVEIARSAGSALYGSDALGGVVSFRTKDPGDYLAGTERDAYLGIRAGYDSRDDQTSGLLTAAIRGSAWQGLVQATQRIGHERSNQGTVGGDGAARTLPNPQDRSSTNLLGKWVYVANARSLVKFGAEWFDARTETEGLSFVGPTTPGTTVTGFDGDDGEKRWRLSAEQTLERVSGFYDQITWRVSAQRSSTDQHTVEHIARTSGESRRDGWFGFEQDAYGADVELRSTPGLKGRHRLTYGASINYDNFDQLRNRSEILVATGQPVPSALAFPTKYSPATDALDLGLYVQDELDLAGGRVRLVPGLRFDVHDLNADQADATYLSGNPGTPPPVDMTASALSPKLGVVGHLTETLSAFGQYARGFRSPPYSDVNNGFSNLTFGYRTLSNPDLTPETSDNFEVGLRGAYRHGSFSASVFDNHYDDFIETVVVNVTPDGVIEFQPQNVNKVTISGVELAGDAAVGTHWNLRGAASWAQGTNETAGEPLESIAPPQLVVGARFRPAHRRWQIELTSTVVTEKRAQDLPEGSTQFRTPSYVVLDLFGVAQLTKAIELQVGLFNLTDEAYWTWPDVRGQQTGSVSIDRYTSPGLSATANLRFSY